MSESETVVFDLEVNASKGIGTLRQLERLAYRVVGLFHRMGLPENIDSAIMKVERFIMTIRLAHSAIVALEAASGPIGWGLAAVGAVSAAWTAYDFALEVTSY